MVVDLLDFLIHRTLVHDVPGGYGARVQEERGDRRDRGKPTVCSSWMSMRISRAPSSKRIAKVARKREDAENNFLQSLRVFLKSAKHRANISRTLLIFQTTTLELFPPKFQM